MKRIIVTMFMALALTCNSLFAAVPISKVDKVSPTDEIYMDMAVSAASKSASAKGLPCGAVIILNNAFRSAGTATANATAEQNAIAKAGLPTLENATIFTVNEPTTEAYNDICKFGADAVVFVNARDKVIAAGVYSAEDYDDSKVDATVPAVPLKQIGYAEAEALLK